MLLEDRRSGELVDVPVAQLLKLTRLPERLDEVPPAARGLEQAPVVP